MKYLSIIIPTYNMEALLPRCIGSLVKSKFIDLLDILIVNDGSKDDSLKVASQFATKYPYSVRVIDKKNGNYGSCINAALPLAQGQYIKILDSDDYVDTGELDKLIAILNGEKVYPDLIITSFSFIYGDSGKTRKMEYEAEAKLLQLDTFNDKDYVQSFFSTRKIGMHAFIYKTSILKEMGYYQTEGISYTDQEWIYYPIYQIATIQFYPFDIYQYCLGRDGQTMSIASLIKGTPQLIQIAQHILKHQQQHESGNASFFAKVYGRELIRFQLSNIFRTVLLRAPHTDYNHYLPDIIRLDRQLKQTSPDISQALDQEIIHKIVPVKYIKYWRLHGHKRFPIWVSQFLYAFRKSH